MSLLAICTGLILILCSVRVFLYSGKVAQKKEPFGKVLVSYILITFLAAIATRYFQLEMPDAKAITALFKFTASLPTVLFALKGYQICRTKFEWYIFLAIGIGMIADIMININLVIGGIAFMAGHLMYDAAFLSEKKPTSKQVTLWLILSALMIIPVFALRAIIGSSFLCIGGWFYFSILISTLVFSWSLEKMVFTAALVFAFSDCFLIANTFLNGNTVMKILALEVYYCALLLYGTVLWRRDYQQAAEPA